MFLWHLSLKVQRRGFLYLMSISLHGLQFTHYFKDHKEKKNPIKPNQRKNRESKTTALVLSNPTNIDSNLLQKKKKKPLWRLGSTLCSRLESLNISENGLICSLLNLSPLRKSMVCSILLLISSGPDWTCKACARWFGSRFIEFLVRAARV